MDPWEVTFILLIGQKNPRDLDLGRKALSFQVLAVKILLIFRENPLEEGFLEGYPQSTCYPQSFSITTSNWIFLLVNVY